MTYFEQILEDTPSLSAALQQLVKPGRRLDELQLLHQSGEHGLRIVRDAGNRVQGPTVWHCSRLGAHLSQHFGTGPRDVCMWIGTIRSKDDEEFWRMRPEVRSALELAGLV